MTKEKLFLQYLKWQTRPSRLRRHLEKKRIKSGNNCAVIDRHAIKVGAVQLQLQFFKSPLAYVDEMSRWASEAAAAGVQLLGFPENNSFQLLGMLPGIEKLAGGGGSGGGKGGNGDGNKGENRGGDEGGNRDRGSGGDQNEKGGRGRSGDQNVNGGRGRSNDTSVESHDAGSSRAARTSDFTGTRDTDPAPPPVADVFRFAGPVFHSIMHETFPYLAKKYGMYIMAGSFPSPHGDHVMNRSFLFGPRGDLLGSQDKVHLTAVEYQWGLNRGSVFNSFLTPLGKLAMPVCMDATYFETFRILRGAGAEIVMIPIANPEPYNYWLALRGIWPRVQESLVYGIKSAMVGEVLGFTLTGRAGIFAPLELSPKGDGVLAEMEHPDREGLVTAELDLEALLALRQNHPYLEDQNPALIKKYFPRIYSGL